MLANACHEILTDDFSLAVSQQALAVGAGGGSQEVHLLLLITEAEGITFEHRRHVVGIDADHVAHHHAGHGGYVVVRAVDHYGQPAGNAAVEGGNSCRGTLCQQAITDDAAGANQHQAVDQLAGAFGGSSAVDEHQGLLAGFGQVYGDGGTVTRCAGDQRVERGAPGVHRMGDHFDLLGHKLRLVGHGGDPRCCCGWWG